MATHHGSVPTRTSAIFWFASPATLKTDTELLSGFTLHTNGLSLVIAMGLERVADVAAVATRAPLPTHGSPRLHEPAMTITPRASNHIHTFRLLRIRPPFLGCVENVALDR